MMLVDFEGNVSPAQEQFAWSSPSAVRPFQPLSLSLKGGGLIIYCWVGIGYMTIIAYHLQCINASSNGLEIQWRWCKEKHPSVVATEAQGWTYDRVSCISGKSWDTKYLKVSDFGLKPVQAVSSDDEA
jgi:hypothetical protein